MGDLRLCHGVDPVPSPIHPAAQVILLPLRGTAQDLVLVAVVLGLLLQPSHFAMVVLTFHAHRLVGLVCHDLGVVTLGALRM